MTIRHDFLSPVGRLVQGSVFEPQTVDAEGKPLVVKSGANAGQPRVNYFFAIAIPKTSPEMAPIFAKMNEIAAAGFPAGQFRSPSFAWKFIDGDGIDKNGKPYAEREGFAGHYVLRYSGSYAPKVHSAGGASVLTDPQSVKRGYYVRVYGSISPNNSTQQPGLYLNHSLVEMVGYGLEIVSGPDGSQVFGQAPAAVLPAGASAIPLAPAGAPMAFPGSVPGAGVPGGVPGAPAGLPPGHPGASVPGAPAGFPGGVPGAGAPGVPGGVPGVPGGVPGGVPAPAGYAPVPGAAGAPPGAPAQAPAAFLNPVPGAGAPPAAIRHPTSPGYVSYDNGATWVVG